MNHLKLSMTKFIKKKNIIDVIFLLKVFKQKLRISKWKEIMENSCSITIPIIKIFFTLFLLKGLNSNLI